MTIVTEEIQEAVKNLNIPKELFVKLPDSDSNQLYLELLNTFVVGGDRRWWWESFKKNALLLHLMMGLDLKESLL